MARPFAPEPVERRNLAPRRRLDLLSWCRQRLYILDGPLVAGGAAIGWSEETFPLQRAVIETIGSPRWRRTYLMCAPQAFGKTTAAALPALLYGIAERRVSALYASAAAHLAVTQYRRRIEPAIEACPQLRAILPESRDDIGVRGRRDFTNGASLHCAGAESLGALAGYTVAVVVCDDLHAWPESLPGVGHPAEEAWARSASYPPPLRTQVGIGQASTTDSYLWRGLMGSTCWCPFVPCPRCDRYQLLDFDRLVYPEDPLAARREALLPCAACDQPITHDDLPAMLRRHRWVSMPEDADWIREPPASGVVIAPEEAACWPESARRTDVAGFWANAMYWPWGATWGDLAAEWLLIRGQPDRAKSWDQHVRVRPWSAAAEDEEALEEPEILAHATPGYAARTVPAEADCVTVTVDVQSGYVYYLVRAWRRADGTSWLVDLGTCGRPLRAEDETTAQRHGRRVLMLTAALDEMDRLTRGGWPHGGEPGRRIMPALGLIDSRFESDTVAAWIRARGRGIWQAIKGATAGARGALWPLRPSHDRRGNRYRWLDVSQAKHVLRRVLRIPAGEPGYWHMPGSGLHAASLRTYARHMSAEIFDRQLRRPAWRRRERHARVDYWDCETYQISAAIACGVQLAGQERARPGRPRWYRRLPARP